ncbi:MAG: ATP-binding protein [Epsilonproteobacteria bacterium]|nr:hypothetical protein [Campylobacterota bacterium]NPA56396.1 ATP-binding protein [Campylobacterota bacterium]
MSDYRKIALLFEDRVTGVEYYETRATMKLKHQFLSILEGESKQMIFLIGEPGSGKTMFLNRVPSIVPKGFRVIQFKTPFFEPKEFLLHLLEEDELPPISDTIEELIEQVAFYYKSIPSLVTIDEAQLLNKKMLELLRILADTKAFWFLLAMHRHESQQILAQPQFRSRPHRILELGALEEDEVHEYLSKELLRAGSYSLQEQFSRNSARLIHSFARGNFRDTKKLLNRLFLLLEYATKEGKKEYQNIDRCLITMAAIDATLLEV